MFGLFWLCALQAVIVNAQDDPKPRQVQIADRLASKLKAGLLAYIGESDEVVRATTIHLTHLLDSADRLPSGDKKFAAILQSSFQFARSRSRDHDPLVENRAAILALAIVLGHHRMATLVGGIDIADHRDKMRQFTGRVTLRGRRDWTQHFWVSAGLVVLSKGVVSDVVGVAKEGLDSVSGSGFSFADLLADRAGTLFAMAATRDGKAARAIQDRLAKGVRVDDIFPSAVGLPEGISAATLERSYGGIGGNRYRSLVDEIERRLAIMQARTEIEWAPKCEPNAVAAGFGQLPCGFGYPRLAPSAQNPHNWLKP